jgi:uncharacterized protein YciI
VPRRDVFRLTIRRIWYLAMRRNLQPREQWTVSIDEHLAWMRQQHLAGTIVISGPTPDRRLGLYLIRAASQADAEKIAGSDPFTAAGHCTFDLIEWDVHQIMGAGPFTQVAQVALRDSVPDAG